MCARANWLLMFVPLLMAWESSRCSFSSPSSWSSSDFSFRWPVTLTIELRSRPAVSSFFSTVFLALSLEKVFHESSSVVPLITVFIISLSLFTPIGCRLYQTCEDGFDTQDRESGPVVRTVFREDDAKEKLFEDCNGTSITSSSKPAFLEGSFWALQTILTACFDRVFDEFDVLRVVFIQSKGETSTVMLWCSWRPRRPKYWVMCHQTVWTRTCGLPFPSFLLSHSSFSSVVVTRLRALFGRLPLLVVAVASLFPQELALNFEILCHE